MTGPKLNEKSFVAGERSGTKATARYVRPSAFKARVVLDLIRGLDVKTADEVLQFTDRHIARDIRKVLASAVANAVNNDSQDADELYVVACFADEGPTLKRFRPRARGRATRINKRSCHITIIVARMSDERIAVIQARQAARRWQSPAVVARRAAPPAAVPASSAAASRPPPPTRPTKSSTPRSSTKSRRAEDDRHRRADGDELTDAADSENTESAEALEADATEDDATADADVSAEVTESDDAEVADDGRRR